MEWSPDGARLLFGAFDPKANHGVVSIVPRLGGQPRHINVAEGAGANLRASWIPVERGQDELVSVHADYDKRVLIVNTRTNDTVPLPVRGQYDWLADGSWSPDGHLFAVVTEMDERGRWFITLVGTKGQTEIISDSTMLGTPRWSPAGDALYYSRGKDEVWRIAISARTRKTVGAPRAVQTRMQMLIPKIGLPRFSITSDAHRMAYVRGYQLSNLWTVKAGEIGKAMQLTSGSSLRWSPVVSPDGRYIAFAQ